MQTINNVDSTVIVMIETPQALENIDAIAAVGGVDILLLGANDLFSKWEFLVIGTMRIFAIH